jgi:hypothetical protein
MDPFNGTTINKLDGGLGRKAANLDNVSLLVIESTVPATDLAIGTAKEVIDLKAAEQLGINASFDDTNNLLAHHHISEVFRINPDAKLYVLFTDGVTRNATIVEAVRTFPDIKLIAYANHVIITPVAIATQVADFQTKVVDVLATDKMLIDVVIIESDMIDDATAISAYPDLRALAAPNVAVCIAQDTTVAASNAAFANYAAIGSALGALSRRSVNENLGSVDVNNKPAYAKGLNYFSLTDVNTGRWLNTSLQSGRTFASLTNAERTELNEKGYIFAGNYAGFVGFYFSNSPVCTAATSDYAYIENNRVWNKAARGIRQALLPRVKRNLLKDPATGFIKQSEVKELEQLALVPLQDMITAEEISGAVVYINPAQSLVDETPLQVSGKIQYNGIIFEFNFDLGGTTSIS